MSLFTKILAGINIIVAFVVMYFAAQAYYWRVQWVNHMDAVRKARDGDLQDPQADYDKTKKDVLAKMDAEKKTAIESDTKNYNSAYSRRIAAGNAAVDSVKNAGRAKLSTETPEAKEVIKTYGAADYQKHLQLQKLDQAPRLLEEEQRLAAEKATLITIREDYKKRKTLLQTQIAQLTKDKEAETLLTKQMEAENADRRQELVKLLADQEEALAARNLAQAREKDLREQLEYMQAKLKRLAEENQKYADEINRREIKP